MNKDINPNKYYSMRELASILPWINNEPTMQKLIKDDIMNNNSKTYKTVVIQRKTGKRYYIKGSTIIELLKHAK